jgi:BirA family biotin operon repressor/biotin-[acetyl-CoA-carboxylase] ligase
VEEVKNIIHLDSVGSTNDFLKELNRTKLTDDWTCVYADFQHKGKGQRGNEWTSKRGENLLCSILHKSKKMDTQSAFLISEWVALSIRNVLCDLGLQNVKIKWPNDILVNGKKVCGILIENTIAGNRISESIIGIGLNVNSSALNMSSTSLKIELGREYQIEITLQKILQELKNNEDLVQFRPEVLQKAYLRNLYGFQESVMLENKEGVWLGEVMGVLPSGIIQIKSNESLREFNFKEIKWLNLSS